MLDPLTDRALLTGSAYAGDAKLRSRMAIYQFAEVAVDPAWRTSAVAWDGTQVVADVGCGNGLDLRLLLAARRCAHVIGIDASPGMLGTLREVAPGRLSLVNADAQHLPLRTGAVDVGLAMHMLYHMPDRAAAIAQLRRIIKPGGVALVSTNATATLEEIWQLFSDAVGEVLHRAVNLRPPLRFTTETGAALLGAEFDDVVLHTRETPLAISVAEPVLAYVDSVREPAFALVGERFDFDATLAGLAARVEDVIRAEGVFRTVNRMGVFVCR